MNILNFKATDSEGFSRGVEYTDDADVAIPLTDYTAAFILCEENGEGETVFTDVSGELVITAAEGRVDINITPEQVQALPIFNSYQLIITSPGGIPNELIKGFFSVVRDEC